MESLSNCEECGRDYRFDLLAECPGCGEATPEVYETRGQRFGFENSDYSTGRAHSSGGFEPLSKVRASKYPARRVDESLLSTLMTDRYFRRFITRTWAGNIYLIGAWLLALSGALIALGLIILMVQIPENFFPFLGSLIILPFLTFFTVLMWRVSVEVFVSVVVIAENTTPADGN